MSNTDYVFASMFNLPEVALPFMNAVHAEELALVEQLRSALHDATDYALCDTLFNEWIQHTHEHFDREERLMLEYDFFATPCHQGEHQQALQQLLAVQQYWLRERDAQGIIGYISEWHAWLQNHISTMDFVTAQFLSQFPITVDA